jgi:hypothetical protein
VALFFGFRLSFSLLTRAVTAALVRFNFIAMRMMDALDSSSDLRSSSSSGIHILLVFCGTVLRPKRWPQTRGRHEAGKVLSSRTAGPVIRTNSQSRSTFHKANGPRLKGARSVA